MNSLLRKLGWLFQRKRKEAELEEELRFHLEEEAAEREADGAPIEEARRAARRDLGNIALLKEDTRATWSWTLWEQLLQDVRYALRTMLANKTFTALAILLLALGIGANTAIFSFMDSILLRSLPVPNPESLVSLHTRTPRSEVHGEQRHDNTYTSEEEGFVGGVFSYPLFELFRQNDSVFSSVFGYQATGALNLIVGGSAAVTQGELVSGEYFKGVGIAPAAGKLFGLDDDRAGAPAVAVMSFEASRKWFGGPANAIGQSVVLNNVPFAVVGVTPPEFFGVDPTTTPALYVPMHLNVVLVPANETSNTIARYSNPNREWVNVMARLRTGVTRAQAQAALAGQFEEFMRTSNTIRARGNLPTLVLKEAGGGLDGLRRAYSKPLYVLLTLVGLILTIACANIANLQLSRAAARRREVAVRLSLGAGRLRVIRQLLTESVLLASMGGALGVAFALWSIRLLTVLLANGRENFTLRAELNWQVLGVAAGLSLLTGLLFGLVPAIQSTRLNLMPTLKESKTGERPLRFTRHVNASRALLVSQIAITLLILVAATLFIRTLSNLESIQIGFNRESLLTFRVNARLAGHRDPEIFAFYNDLQQQFSAIPGVRSASLSDLPLLGGGNRGTMVNAPGAERKSTGILRVGSRFFTTMEIPILLGRAVEERDEPNSPMVAVVNETFVKTHFGDKNPIGQHLVFPTDCAKCDVEIVGVAGDALYGKLTGKVHSVVFFPFTQNVTGPVAEMLYELRTTGNPLNYVDSVREIVQRADQRMPLFDVKTQAARIDYSIGDQIVFARLCTAFAILALTIACVGLYGTMSYTVTRRSGEIGIRMALGAQRRRVVWMVLKEVLLLVAVALAISVPAVLATSKLIESFLFGMNGNDVVALTAAVVILAAAATLAGYVPARNASRIDPNVALRHE
jgi:predicted permease